MRGKKEEKKKKKQTHTRRRSNHLFSSDEARSAFLIFFPSYLHVYIRVYLTSVFHSYKSSLPDLCFVVFIFVTIIDTMNNGNSTNGTFVFFDNIAAQDLLSKAKVCF